MVEDTHTSRPPSPAETLRRAAALMRERAEAALEGMSGLAPFDARVNRAVGRGMWRSHAEHVAAWDPAVALAVADWLNTIAAKQEAAERLSSRLPVANLDEALTIASAYLEASR